MLEGAQGFLLDPDFGTYPFATSSSPTAAGACLGSGIAPTYLTHVIGVYKAYQTRVGAGPMPTELDDETGEMIREVAHEYGTVSKRPRRCGWFDGVAAAFSARVNGIKSAFLTRLDVLDKIPEIKICTKYELEGKTIDYFPASLPDLAKCVPIYEALPGWETPIDGILKFEELPENARKYISRLEEVIGCPVSIISVGAHREQTIVRQDIFS
jgi:adenylosuccinate synthase